MDGIRIALERSGGLGGLVARGDLDTAQLSGAEVERVTDILRLLEDSAASGGAPAPIPDVQRYEFTVTRAGRVRRLVFDDLTLPAEARPLVEQLLRRGAP